MSDQWKQSRGVWHLADDPPTDTRWPEWFITQAEGMYVLFDFAAFPHSSYPDLDSAKFALLMVRRPLT